MHIGQYELVNEEKVDRVLNGVPGTQIKGLGENPSDDMILAHYDKYGGYIRGKEGAKVKHGSFWDIANNVPRKEPQVVYVFRINGREIEIADGQAIPLEVNAAVQQQAEDAAEHVEDAKPKNKAKK